MSRACSTCAHPSRDEVDGALVARTESIRDVARRFGLSSAAVGRHAKNCIPGLLAERASEAKEQRSDSLKDRVRVLWDEAMALGAEARAGGDIRTALLAIDRLRALAELQARGSGEFAASTGVTVNVAVVRPDPSPAELRHAAALAMDLAERDERARSGLTTGQPAKALGLAPNVSAGAPPLIVDVASATAGSSGAT